MFDKAIASGCPSSGLTEPGEKEGGGIFGGRAPCSVFGVVFFWYGISWFGGEGGGASDDRSPTQEEARAPNKGPTSVNMESTHRLVGEERISSLDDRSVGLVVKASASRAEYPGFESRLRRNFSGVESYQ